MLTLTLPLLRGVCSKISYWSKIAKDAEAVTEETEVWSPAPSRLMATVSPGMVRRAGEGLAGATPASGAAARRTGAGVGEARGGGRVRADSPDVVTDAQRYERERGRERGRSTCGGCERISERVEEEESEEEGSEEEESEEDSEEEITEGENSDEGTRLTAAVKEIMMRTLDERTR